MRTKETRHVHSSMYSLHEKYDQHVVILEDILVLLLLTVVTTIVSIGG